VPFGSDPRWSELPISLIIKVISICRCDVVFRVGVTKVMSSLGVIPVPARSVAWFSWGRVRILSSVRLRASVLSPSSVFGGAISGGRVRSWRIASSPSGGLADTVVMSSRKFWVVVSCSSSGSDVRSLISHGSRLSQLVCLGRTGVVVCYSALLRFFVVLLCFDALCRGTILGAWFSCACLKFG